MYDFCFACQDLVPSDELVMGLCGECWKDEQENLGIETGVIPIEKAPSKLAEEK